MYLFFIYKGGGRGGGRGGEWIQRAVSQVERPARRVGEVLQEERNQHLVQDVRLLDGLGGILLQGLRQEDGFVLEGGD